MAPLAGAPILLPENIKPVRGARSKSQLGRLKSAAGPGNQKLPQRIDTDDAFRHESLELIVTAERCYPKAIVLNRRFRVLRTMIDF